MHQRLAIVIRDVDNWLSQQVPKDDEPVCEAAVGAYAYTGEAHSRRRVRVTDAAKKTRRKAASRKPSKRRP